MIKLVLKELFEERENIALVLLFFSLLTYSSIGLVI